MLPSMPPMPPNGTQPVGAFPTSGTGMPAPRLTGTALRWHGSYGFVKPDDGGEDLFCHSNSIRDGVMLKEGTPVQYVKRMDERKGRDQAFDVTGGCSLQDGYGGMGGGGRGGVTGPPPPGKLLGTVSRWSNKGFGFITPADGGEDLFCHFSKIEDGNALHPGAMVHFVKAFDEVRGNDRAVQIVGGFREKPPYQGGGNGGYGGGGGYGGMGYGGAVGYGGGGYGGFGGGYGGGGYGVGGGFGGGGYGGGPGMGPGMGGPGFGGAPPGYGGGPPGYGGGGFADGGFPGGPPA